MDKVEMLNADLFDSFSFSKNETDPLDADNSNIKIIYTLNACLPNRVSDALVFEVQERKELIKGSFKDRHFNAGSLLLGFGVLEAIGGGVNTWFRTGKLFPGPHLFAGAAITALWALAAALVPAMQKGNETARNLHITLNALNVILFIWQIPTGIEIVFKVFEFTTWP